MKVKIEIDDTTVKSLIVKELENKLGINFNPQNVSIKVRSRQNYREKEFEHGEILATYEGEV